MWMIAGAVLALPLSGVAQGPMGEQGMTAWHEEQLADFETMRDKFVSLAEAFPEDTWDWTPMEDVRSVRDVMALIVAEGYLFPVLWGVEPPDGVEEAFGAEMERVGAMSRADVIREVERAFEHLLAATRGLSLADQVSDASWFGESTTVVGAVARASGDMHEHLGQAIAYARTNHIVPPWSR
jgi:hypothetical protein